MPSFEKKRVTNLIRILKSSLRLFYGDWSGLRKRAGQMLEGPIEGCCNQQVRERGAWNTVARVQTAVLGKTIERRGGWPRALSLQLHDVKTNASAKARFAAPQQPARTTKSWRLTQSLMYSCRGRALLRIHVATKPGAVSCFPSWIQSLCSL